MNSSDNLMWYLSEKERGYHNKVSKKRLLADLRYGTPVIVGYLH